MKKIKVKLTHRQLSALVTFFENCLSMDQPETNVDKILSILITRFYLKLKSKAIMLEPRNYTLQVEPETALAFVEWFNGTIIKPTTYEGVIILKMLNHFDKSTTYAGVY